MSITTALVTFFLIWWVVLFAVLPWGIQRQDEGGEVVAGTDPGAPSVPNIPRKLMWTTLVAALIFAAWCVVYMNHWLTIARLTAPFGLR